MLGNMDPCIANDFFTASFYGDCFFCLFSFENTKG